MKNVLSNLATVARRPRLGVEYAGWLLNSALHQGHPVRKVHGVSLGRLNGFSEYHSVARGVSATEKRFIEMHPFGPGAIIDVGANLGLFTLLLSQRFPERSIIAFEPNPSTFAALQNNVVRSQARNVRCHAAAVTDHEGFVSFATREHARANASITADRANMVGTVVESPCTTLDTFIAHDKVGQISLLKVDVEGFELPVFRGAERLLSELRPGVIYFEVCPGLAARAGFDPTAAAACLEGHGYQLQRLRDNGTLEAVTPRAAVDVVVENWVALASQ